MKIPRTIEGGKVKLMLVDRADAERIATKKLQNYGKLLPGTMRLSEE